MLSLEVPFVWSYRGPGEGGQQQYSVGTVGQKGICQRQDILSRPHHQQLHVGCKVHYGVY